MYFLWRFFITLGGINLLARDIYDDRAIANLSFYTSDILRKKGGYLRFLIGYSLITGLFIIITAGILYLEQKVIVYNFFTNIVYLLILLSLTIVILTYCMGDGFSNMIMPTNPVLLIGLSIGGVSYGKWFKWTWKLQVFVFLFTLLFILFAVSIGY